MVRHQLMHVLQCVMHRVLKEDILPIVVCSHFGGMCTHGISVEVIDLSVQLVSRQLDGKLLCMILLSQKHQVSDVRRIVLSKLFALIRIKDIRNAKTTKYFN